MSVLSWPLRRDERGQLATIPEGSPIHAAQITGHVLACNAGERGLAPAYGLPDVSGAGVDEALLTAVVETCEPDITVTDVSITGTTELRVRAAVTWSTDGEAEVARSEEDIP